MDYFITLEKELMIEDAASIIATITRYVIAKHIQNETKHPLNILETMIYEQKDDLIGKEYTMEELNLIKAKFEFAREYADKVIEASEEED